jgi:hypothetical protein
MSVGDLELEIDLTNTGTLAPGGVGTVGTMSFIDGFTQTNSGLLLLDIHDTQDHDQLGSSGPISLDGSLQLDADFASPPSLSSEIILIDNDGTDPISGAFVGMVEGTQLTLDGYLFELSYIGGDGNDVSLTAISPPPGNQPPDALNDAYEIHHGDTLVAGAGSELLYNDTDPEFDPLTVVAVNAQTNAVGQAIQITGGSLTVEEDGTFVFVPTPGFIGVSSFTYNVSDGTSSDTATVAIHVTNEAPVADDDAYYVVHDQPLIQSADYGLLDGDADIDSDILTVYAVNGDPEAVGESITLPSGASLTVDQDGSIMYYPAAGFVGLDSFTYTVTDGADFDTATVTIQVTNQAPTAHNDYYWVLENDFLIESGPTGLLANDVDPDYDPLTVVAVNGVAFEEGFDYILIVLDEGGTLIVYSDGSFDYTPAADFVGVESFTYTIFDGVDYATATVTITVEEAI